MSEEAAAQPPEQMLRTCADKRAAYTTRELEFLRSASGLVQRGIALTAKQIAWLAELANRELLDFAAINSSALAVLTTLCRRWLPDGVLYGKEWVARNPTRADGRAGSFQINVQTGRWADFATGDKGGDPISLAAYLHCAGDQVEGAIGLKRVLSL